MMRTYSPLTTPLTRVWERARLFCANIEGRGLLFQAAMVRAYHEGTVAGAVDAAIVMHTNVGPAIRVAGVWEDAS